MKKLIYFVIITIITSSSIFAQSAYVGNGNSAYGFFGAYATGSKVDVVGIGGGYGINGIFDLKYQYSNAEVAQRYRTDHQSAHSFGLTIHPLNIQTIPFKFSLNTELSIFERYTAYSLVPIVHLDTRLSKKAFLKFYTGVGYANIADSYRIDNVLKQFGFSVFTNNENKNIFVVDIGYTHFNHEYTFGISLGMFFGSPTNSPLPKYEPKHPKEKEKIKQGSYYDQ